MEVIVLQGKSKDDFNSGHYEMSSKTQKFFFLSLDIPESSLFKENSLLTTIQQQALLNLFKKYDGHTLKEDIDANSKTKYKILKLPEILVVHLNRFT